MKRAIIGGFLSLIGTIIESTIVIFVGNNMVANWQIPPGRFLTTVSQKEMAIPMIIGLIFLLLGLVIMGIEYIRKDK